MAIFEVTIRLWKKVMLCGVMTRNHRKLELSWTSEANHRDPENANESPTSFKSRYKVNKDRKTCRSLVQRDKTLDVCCKMAKSPSV